MTDSHTRTQPNPRAAINAFEDRIPFNRFLGLRFEAFAAALGDLGGWIVTLSIVFFAVSTMTGYAYYGRKCFAYLAGPHRAHYYDGFYVAGIVVGAVWTADAVINLLDTSFA